MAPTDQKIKNKKFTAKDGNLKKSKNTGQSVKKKRKWIPEHKMFDGSVKEGQGFAFKRKQRVKHEYNKLLRREKKKNSESKMLYKEEYPEHLRHLYMAEAEKLKNEAWANRVNRSKLRMKGQEKEVAENEAAAQPTEAADAGVSGGSELTDSVSANPEPTKASEKESIPMSNRMRKKLQKQTSYQKTKEDFERIKEKRRKKKEVKCSFLICCSSGFSNEYLLSVVISQRGDMIEVEPTMKLCKGPCICSITMWVYGDIHA
uniref:Thyroid transcription factor 1-associated protein 26 homolog n=1 Tax=Acanthochromis polyacanthus TaxID=80966 RepID=A0A3Q1GRG3_9TELE